MCYSGTHAHTRAPCAHTFVLLDGFLVTSARSWWQVPSADPRLLQTQPLVLPPGSPRALQARPEGGGMEHREVVTSTWLDSQDSPASPPGRHLLDSLQPAEASPPDTAASAGELLGVRSKNRCSPPPPRTALPGEGVLACLACYIHCLPCWHRDHPQGTLSAAIALTVLLVSTRTQ